MRSNRCGVRIFLFLFFLLLAVGTAWAKITFKDFGALSDTDISPQGKTAFHSEISSSWYHAESKHFVYHFMSRQEAMEPYIGEAELYYGWVKEIFGVVKDSWNKKAHIFVFTKDAAWNKYNERARTSSESALAFTSGWELFIHHSSNADMRIKTVSHELTHVLLFRFLDGEPPLFLNEGFSEYVSYRAMLQKRGQNNAKIKIIQPIPAAEFIPLGKLHRMTSYPPGKVDVFYVESEALVRFLIRRWGGDKFYLLLKECARGKAFPQAVEKIYGVSFLTLEQDFRNYAVR